MPSSLSEPLIATEFYVTEEHWSLDLTEAKYSIIIPFMVEQENVILRINPGSFISREKRKETKISSQTLCTPTYSI
jgi:hypothetical protein